MVYGMLIRVAVWGVFSEIISLSKEYFSAKPNIKTLLAWIYDRGSCLSSSMVEIHDVWSDTEISLLKGLKFLIVIYV